MNSSAKSNQIIAIDGPAGAGKSSVSKALAAKLNYSYVDTGAMYRAITLKALRQKVPLDNEETIVDLAKNSTVKLAGDYDNLTVLLDGEDVSKDIRTGEVTNNTYAIARVAALREILVDWQRAMGDESDIVIEGRDAGTVIFPKATFKFYLDADVQERMNRRLRELEGKGEAVDPVKLLADMKMRDHRDSTREASPLKKADDAIVLDSTGMSVDDCVVALIELMK
ncbi:MAG: cytidylate kinase [Lysobacterales bacterium]|jgi:cytidylate kinase